MSSPADLVTMNEELIAQLESPGMVKNAEDALTAYTRTRAREDGIFRKAIPMQKAQNKDLTRQVDTDNPAIVFDKEPGSPAAVSVGFATAPIGFYIKAPRWLASFSRIQTDRFQKDLDQLRTWQMDIRQVFSDAAVKDIQAEEDACWLAAINTMLKGPDTVVPTSGVAQWQTVWGGITPDTVQEALAIMGKTPSHFEPKTIIINSTTIRQILKWNAVEAGPELTKQFLTTGFGSIENFMGVDEWIITNKRDLVPDDSMFMLGDPRTIGKSMYLTDVTMYVKREATMIEWYNYETIAGGIAHSGGLSRADFA